MPGADQLRSNPPRADARRSIQRITAAAQSLLRRRGASVTLNEVALEAGVAPATLYRHFPSRMHLFEHVYRDRMTQLAGSATALTQAHDPLDAFIHWLQELLTLSTEARGALQLLLSEGLRETDPAQNARWAFQTLVDAGGVLLSRCQESGGVRNDVGVEEVVRLMSGIVRAAEFPPVVESPEARRQLTEKLFNVALSGLLSLDPPPRLRCTCS